jgi:hypothetical protein
MIDDEPEQSVPMQRRPRFSPSLLARKILCPAYIAAPIDGNDRLRFLSFHALAVVKVISRHLRMGYNLKAVERGGPGFRIDLLFESPTGTRRLTEVKSAKRLREVHKLQAALYHVQNLSDEISVSNGDSDEILDPDFIYEARRRAETTRNMLMEQPDIAAHTYIPNEDTCYTCSNSRCPFQTPKLPEGILTK